MKKLTLLSVFWFIAIYVMLGVVEAFAQSPQSFNYQLIARDTSGAVFSNKIIGLQISLLKDSENGLAVYSERHLTITNKYGLVNIGIGTGNIISGNFQSIDWGLNTYFVKLEIDPVGGTNYFTMGISQLMSVPYSLYAEKAGNVVDTSNTNELQTLSISNDTIYLTNGGFVKLPPNVGVWALDGNNISNSNSGFVGIGTNNPTSALHVNGSVRITDESEGDGKVLTSDNNGNASWQAPFSGNVTGTANYVPKFTGTNSIGNSMVYETNNKMGIGTKTPTGRVVIKGDSLANDSVPLFEVQDKTGKTVLVVWPDGVHVYVNESAGKANNKGSFAVSGKSTAKGIGSEVFVVNPNDVRIYLDESGANKANNKGSFAVSGKSTAKGVTTEYLSVNSDSIKASKSLYIPRMTSLERDSLGFVPSEALIIFNITDKCMQIYENSVWSNIWCFNCAPAIIIQPIDKIICSGTNTNFFISLTGTNLVYQWQVSIDGGSIWSDISNNSVYSGATAWNLSLSNAPVNYNGYKYRCNVSASCPPSVTSYVVTLNVSAASSIITEHPINKQLTVDCTTSFSVTTAGYGVSYQWQASADSNTWYNVLEGGAPPVYLNDTTSTVSLSFVPLSYNNYKYRCVTSNFCGTENSSVVTLTVNPPITISAQPIDKTLSNDCAVMFNVSTAGSTTGIIYQWQESSDGGTSWSNISNGGANPYYADATTNSLKMTSMPISYIGYKYRCVLSHFCRASITSNAGTLISSSLTISSQPPVNNQLAINCTKTIGLFVSGTGILYQWQQSTDGGTIWSDITNGGTNPLYGGATTNSLYLQNMLMDYGTYKYRCAVSNSCHLSSNSNVAMLTAVAPTISVQPVDKQAWVGQNANFSITSTGFIYQWQESVDGGSNWADISNGGTAPVYSGASTSPLSLTNIPAGFNNYKYRCIVSGSCSPASTSNAVTLSVVACSTLTDVDGNTYNAIGIGNQCWMKENLKTSKYKNSTAIPNTTVNAAWSALTTGAYCDYNNTPSNSTTYGKLYNWYAINAASGLCPTSWHIPSDAEWTTLTTYLGGESVAGGKMKESGTTHWASPNTSANNSSGFTGLPGGYRNYDGAFYDVGSVGNFWSASEYSAADAWFRKLSYNYADVYRYNGNKAYGFSVRCLRD